jgi:CRP-like cAMP-binding protein
MKEFSAGETIFEEGDPGDVMYVILDGDIDVRLKGQSINMIGPGEIVGEMALIDSSPRSADVVAVTDCRLAVVDEKQFLFMVQQTPPFALHVMRALVEKIRHMDRLV